MDDEERDPPSGTSERLPLIGLDLPGGNSSSQGFSKHQKVNAGAAALSAWPQATRHGTHSHHHHHQHHAVSTLEMEESPVQFKHPFTPGQRRYITALFTLMASLLFADQNLLAPNLSAAAQFFGFDETEKDEKLGGYIGAAFFAVGAPAALLVGWYGDRVNRRNLLFGVAVFGQAPCLCTIFVTKYWQFFILRIMTGISVGGAFPLLYSLLGDLFPTSQRALVSSFIQIATGAGVFVGQFLAALIGPATDWRLPFVIVASPSLLVALLMLLTTKEPPRGACEEAVQAHAADMANSQASPDNACTSPNASYANGRETGITADLASPHRDMRPVRATSAAGDPASDPGTLLYSSPYSEKITWSKVRLLLTVPSNWFVFLQGFPGSLPWGMFITYFNDYLQQKNHMTPGVATLIVTLFGAGNAVGVVGGGALGQWLYNRRKEGMPLLAGTCVLLGVGPALFLVNADLTRLFGLGVAMAVGGGVLASVAAPCVKAVTLNVNDPETRGVALAVQAMTDDLGKALGPFIVAGFIRRLGRQSAFNLSVCSWVPCGLLLMGLIWCMSRDEDAMQARLKQKLNASTQASERQEADGRGGDVPEPAPFPALTGLGAYALRGSAEPGYGNIGTAALGLGARGSQGNNDSEGDAGEGDEDQSRLPLLPLSRASIEPIQHAAQSWSENHFRARAYAGDPLSLQADSSMNGLGNPWAAHASQQVDKPEDWPSGHQDRPGALGEDRRRQGASAGVLSGYEEGAPDPRISEGMDGKQIWRLSGGARGTGTIAAGDKKDVYTLE